LVSIQLRDLDAPGSPHSRVMCVVCGEGVNDGREILDDNGDAVCRCRHAGTYYSKLDHPTA
jgi:hypothetical protein